MAQLLTQNIETLNLVSFILRQEKDLGQDIILREDGINTPNFAKLSAFKDVVLNIGRHVNAEFINDVIIINTKPGERRLLDLRDNRCILILESSSTFNINDKQFTPENGQLIWTNEDLIISNNSLNNSYFLIIDFKEFIL